MSLISGSVGANGDNIPKDVRTVQRLLNKHVVPPLRDLSIDGIAGKNTIDAIKRFQSEVVKMRSPDGRVDPGGETIRRLNRGPEENRTSGQVPDQRKENPSNLSGEKWWKANQAKYRNSRELQDLEGDFREKATKFITALRQAGANISVSSTRRHKIRAHLMHYSWKISKGDIRASDVPSIAGLDIQWDHGNDEDSRKAATKMVELFNIAYPPSLTSNHINGTAIDMTITWNGDLAIRIPGQEKTIVIRTGPRTGPENEELHRLGRDYFGIIKLRTDPPHWSHNGR